MAELTPTRVVTDAEAEAFELRMLADPWVRPEIDRYEPVVAKLTDASLLAIIIAARRESRRRAAEVPRLRRVGIGNR